MLRAALYARFSSDLQNPSSIEDQLRVCRAHAERIGATVVAEYADAAMSGAVASNRPQFQALMAAAEAGEFDVVIAEALDRLTRSGGGAWDLWDGLRACGVAISTLSEGDVQTLHVGLKGTMNAMFLEELARKTRRGLEGVILSGRMVGTPPYGYRLKRRLTEAGELVKGEWEIDPAEAGQVVRIYRLYAAGASPQAIAYQLNKDGVPAPGGKDWCATTIRGSSARGIGILANPIYHGELVWGRFVYATERRTGVKRMRKAPADRIRTAERPHLRIVPEDLWLEVQVKREALSHARPEAARRPRRLLSGLVRCALCGSHMTISSDGAGRSLRYLCQTRYAKGPLACPTTRTANAERLEQRVLAALRAEILHPVAVEVFVREYHTARAERARDDGQRRHQLQRELGEAERRSARLVDQIADGMLSGRAVADKLAALEARRGELEAELAKAADPSPIALHPEAPARYRAMIERLQEALPAGHEPEDQAARQALRELVKAVWVHPEPGAGNFSLSIDGDLGPLVDMGAQGETAWAAGSGSASSAGTTRRGTASSTPQSCRNGVWTNWPT